MSPELRRFFGDLALASGVGLAVGAMVACAAYPLFEWWANRSTVPVEATEGPSPSRTDAPGTVVARGGDRSPFRPSVTPSSEFDGDFAPAVERLIGGHKP